MIKNLLNFLKIKVKKLNMILRILTDQHSTIKTTNLPLTHF